MFSPTKQEQQYVDPYHWDTKNHHQRFIYSSITKKIVDLVCDTVSLYPYDRFLIIDAGCGDGLSTLHIALHFQASKNIQVIGLDYSDRAIQHALNMTQSYKLSNLSFHASSLLDIEDNLPVDSTSVKVILVLREVVEHISDSDLQLFANSTFIKTRNIITTIVTVPSVQSPVEAKHYRHYDQNTLEQLLRSISPKSSISVSGYYFRPRILYYPIRFIKDSLGRFRLSAKILNFSFCRSIPVSYSQTLIGVLKEHK